MSSRKTIHFFKDIILFNRALYPDNQHVAVAIPAQRPTTILAVEGRDRTTKFTAVS
jgi:hypothetical protein